LRIPALRWRTALLLQSSSSMMGRLATLPALPAKKKSRNISHIPITLTDYNHCCVNRNIPCLEIWGFRLQDKPTCHQSHVLSILLPHICRNGYPDGVPVSVYVELMSRQIN